MATLDTQIADAVHGHHPIIYLQSAEEDRVLQALQAFSSNHYGQGSLIQWSCTHGLQNYSESTCDPVIALKSLAEVDLHGFVVMKDLPRHFDRPAVIRALRDVYYALLDNTNCCLVILSPELQVPQNLEKELFLIEVPLPDTTDIRRELETMLAEHEDLRISDELLGEVALSLRGLSLNEIRHVCHRLRQLPETNRDAIHDEIAIAKQNLVRKAGFLEYVPVHRDLAAIGGLENLREWMSQREDLFNQEAVDQGLPMPKGILLMGVSGCGKSLACKTVAAQWRIPLFRLDMNLVFSGMYGSPEAAFHGALKTIESLAPAIVWIDEIENGLGITAGSGLAQNQVFSAFLTWMQEKPPLIFVAATANNIQSLPAEIIRKGRFDQVFFCDLPSEEERTQILRIHLQRQGADVDSIDVNYLAIATDNWNGAEIEQAVIAARLEAHRTGQELTTKHVSRQARSFVPLSETMSEQIKALRDWAWGRAATASKSARRV